MAGMAKQVALALAKASALAGQTLDKPEIESVEQRAENLLRDGEYGPYVAEGDPGEWGGDGTVATIYMEQKGTPGDCYLPLDYYGEEQPAAMDVAFVASRHLPDGHYIEFINAAVAVVYKDE